MPKILVDPTNKILLSAAEVLKKVGEDVFSMRLVAKKAKVSVGTIYNYYPNKEELLKAVNKKQGELFCKEIASFKAKGEEGDFSLLYAKAKSAVSFGQDGELLLNALKKAFLSFLKNKDKDPVLAEIASEVLVEGIKKDREEALLIEVLKALLS